MKLRYLALAATLATGITGYSYADTYPSKPITMVVPFSPGGVSDTTARPLAMIMTKLLGQPIVVENRPGAGGGIGMAYAAKAAPDGYTIMMALPSISAIPEANKVEGKAVTYTTSQFEAIARASADPTVLVVGSSTPWHSLKEFVDDAKKNPGTISYSTSGVNGTTHVAMERFAHAADIELLHIPYSGGGEQVSAVLGNHVKATTQTYGNTSQHIKSGKMRPLAVQSDHRLPTLPDVPTMKELGYDAEYYLWAGLFAPVGLPENVRTTLREAAKKAIADPAFETAMNTMGTPIQYLDAPEFEKFWRTDEKHQVQVINNIAKSIKPGSK
ncbi:MAG TPA: tripartite tricarboxylate transporter substrate binding protein [Eoetvoesiella sp.]